MVEGASLSVEAEDDTTREPYDSQTGIDFGPELERPAAVVDEPAAAAAPHEDPARELADDPTAVDDPPAGGPAKSDDRSSGRKRPRVDAF